MKKLKFTKMQGSGNDFILIDDREAGILEQKKEELARVLCRRKFSVGADGVLFICKHTTSSYDMRMRVFNADGSEAEMCGNGIRCFAKYVYEKGIVRKQSIKVETLAGLIVPEVEVDENGVVTSIRVFMGEREFDRIDEPFFVNEQLGEIKLTSLSLGNPHAVVILDSFDGFDVDTVGKAIESHEAFPNKTNVDFVMLNGKNEISVRTYERGVGETLSCGTGSTASVLTLNKLGYVNLNEPVIVHTKGGDLIVELKAEGAYLTGPAEEVYEGMVELNI
jgi:diaminopimelate epimerase